MDTADRLSTALADEATARTALLESMDAVKSAQAAHRAANAAYIAAGRRRQLAYLQSRHRELMRCRPPPLLVVASPPINDPDAERELRCERLKNAAIAALLVRGPLLALELAPIMQIPARAVRNYLGQDARFFIDHVHYRRREAVRVSLKDGGK